MLRFFKSGWSVLEIFQKIFCISFMMTEGWWAAIFCFLTWSRTKVPKNKVMYPQAVVDILESLKKGWKPQQIYFCSTTLRIQTFLYCCTRRGCGRFNCFYLCSRTINGNILNQVQVGERKVFHECMNRSPKKNLSHRSITSSFSVVVIANCLSPLPTGWALTFISTMH